MFRRADGMTPVPLGSLDRFSGLRVHLIGIGGSGMSAAAHLLLALGAKVSGSDLVPFEGLGALVARGARVSVGHRREQVHRDVDLVVVSAAILEGNPELAIARARNVPVIKYAELIGAMMAGHRRGTAIAGTHGKSTTTALCTHLCREAHLEPSFLCGATSPQLGSGSALGTGAHFIVESCEFDRSFLCLNPEAAAILNIEPDHLDCYRNLDEIVEAFARFSGQVDPAGLLVYNADDPRAAQAAEAATARVQTFGMTERADWRALHLHGERGCFAFTVQFRGSPVVSARLAIPGRHNVANALAAIALAYHAGAGFSTIARALPRFTGVDRRLTWRGNGHGVTIIDDYAHHPTEIRVSIEAARFRYAPKRTWVVFQPHQHSRTRLLMREFAESFLGADEIVVPDVYGARGDRETTDSNGSEELVTRICKTGARARYVPSLHAAAELVAAHVAEGDLVLIMGAGDVWKVADELVARFCEPN